MNVIDKYFHSVIVIAIGFLPAGIGLLLFDHAFLSNSDILKTVNGEVFWGVIVFMYSTAFYGIYKISTLLVHPKTFKAFGIDPTPPDDDWKAVIVHMVICSAFAILITWLRKGNFIHFVGNSLIVAGCVNAYQLVSYFIASRIKTSEEAGD